MFKPQESKKPKEYALLTAEEAAAMESQESQRSRLFSAQESLVTGVDMLQEANQVGLETDQITREMIFEVDRQGNVLSGARQKNKNIQDRLKEGRALARKMLRREYLSKIILAVLFVVLLISVALVLYFRFIHPQVSKMFKDDSAK